MFGWCSGGFNRTEPPLPPALLRHHGMECAYALVCSVRRHRTSIPAAVQEIQCVQGGAEPPQTHVKEHYTLCYICNDVVQEGSRRFDALELHRTSAKAPCTPCFSSKYVDRGQSNHPEPMLKNSTHFFISAMMWFEKVRGGSMHLNVPKLVKSHPAHLASPLNM